jgi:hypothetical protein
VTTTRIIFTAAIAAAAFLAAAPSVSALTLGTPTDVIGHLSPADFTGFGYGINTYKDWGNEPSITVNPLNPQQMVVSSFAYNTNTTTSGADIFLSNDGGATWSSNFTVPAPANGVTIPNDWRFMYDASGNLHGAVLGSTSNGTLTNIYHGVTTNPTSLAAWTWTGGGAPINVAPSTNGADQPWIALAPGGKVFVAYDDFNNFNNALPAGGVKERVSASANNGTSFTSDNLVSNGGFQSFTNPGLRIAAAPTGTVFSIFGNGTSNVSSGVQHVDYYVNRSRDGGATWDFTSTTPVGGLLIDGGSSTQVNNSSATWFAGVNELLGNVTAVTSDSTGNNVYVLYGKQDINNIDRIYLTKGTAVANTLVFGPGLPISVAGERACLPTLTVLDDGTIVMEYDSFNTTSGKIEVHIASSADQGLTVASDNTVYQYTPASLAALGIASSNRELGDYQYITSVGNTFYATFNGIGNVNSGGINTTALLDPFVITGTSVPEPATLLLLLAAAPFALTRRRPA